MKARYKYCLCSAFCDLGYFEQCLESGIRALNLLGDDDDRSPSTIRVGTAMAILYLNDTFGGCWYGQTRHSASDAPEEFLRVKILVCCHIAASALFKGKLALYCTIRAVNIGSRLEIWTRGDDSKEAEEEEGRERGLTARALEERHERQETTVMVALAYASLSFLLRLTGVTSSSDMCLAKSFELTSGSQFLTDQWRLHTAQGLALFAAGSFRRCRDVFAHACKDAYEVGSMNYYLIMVSLEEGGEGEKARE